MGLLMLSLSLGLSLGLSLHAVAGRAGVVDAVRIAAVVVVVDEGQRQGRGLAGLAAAATHRVKHGRTRTKHDRVIMTENEDTIERWAKQGGPAASR
jgi:hypothetical protein